MDYIECAKEVITSYPIIYQDIEFIRHNENMIFKVTCHHKAYVLRIHKSNVEGLSGIQHTYEGLNSEMEFLRYLNSYSDLRIQKPIANSIGEYVTTHQNNQLSVTFYSTLLEWVEGSPMKGKEDNIENIVFKFGEKVAILHEASRLFKPDNNFIRPVYSVDNLETTIHDLSYGIEVGLFDQKQYELMVKVADKIIVKIKELDQRENAWGMIHADYQLGNVIINQDEVGFIDFGLSGYGYYLFDLGSAATIIDCSLRNAFFRGYASKTAFTLDDLEYIECLIFADVFLSYKLFVHDEKNRGWIKEHAEKMCSNLAPKFLSGEKVFDSL